MLKKSLKYTAYRLAPKLAFRFDQLRLARRRRAGALAAAGGSVRAKHDPEALVAEAARVSSACNSGTTIDQWIDIVNGSPLVRSNQRRTEIAALLRLVEELKPSVVCEIGAAGGGTLALFSRVAAPDAHFISIDLAYTEGQRKAFPLLVRPAQKLTILDGDSHSQDTVERLKSNLSDREIDFLFIDGDHSYKGVAKDYEMYSPFVRKGGCIGFHDVVEDYRTRYGLPTSSDVGGVPEYWRELKSKVSNAEEFIEHPWQDGLGIGVVRP